MGGPDVAPRAAMSDQEYQECQAALLELARTALLMPDLGLFLQRIGTAHAIGPILDPTLYRRAGANLEAVEHLAKAALTLQLCARRQAGLSG